MAEFDRSNIKFMDEYLTEFWFLAGSVQKVSKQKK
jgi:hypothetical protein